MIKSEIIARLTGLVFFYRWHPEVALRYLPIVDQIRKMKGNINILDIGSGGLGITPYLKREVTGVDLEFLPPLHRSLKKVKASAMKLPFKNNSFDIVLSVDMLEHLNRNDRQLAIDEMFRVARKVIFIAVPCGNLSTKQDYELDKLYFDKYKKHYHFLEEQLSFGLPEARDIKKSIIFSAKRMHKIIRLKEESNENLKLRRFLMKGFISDNIIINIFFRKLLLFALPFFRLMNSEPVYRKIFKVDLI